MFTNKKKIEELENGIESYKDIVLELCKRAAELERKYKKLKSSITGLGRKLGVELILDEEDEQVKILSGIVEGKGSKKWVTPEELNKEE